MKVSKRLLFNLIQAVVLFAVAIAIWYVAAAVVNSELILPQPHEVLIITLSLLGKGSTYVALLYTLLRAIVAFAFSLGVAVGLILFTGCYSTGKFVVDAIVTFLRALPTIAVILITLILFNSFITPVIVAFLVVFPVIFGTLDRTLIHNAKLMDLCKVYHVKPLKKVKLVLLPLICQDLTAIVKENLPLCIKIVVAGEVLALPLAGIGRQMYVAKVNLDTANVVALTVLVLAVCFLISCAVSMIERCKK